jgi:DNA-binding Lrp family transcriptional regulator
MNRAKNGRFVKTAQTTKLLNALQKGETFTAKEAAKRFNMPVANVSKRVYDLRSEGYCVYSNRVSGSTEVSYRIGTPSKAIVAAAFQAGAVFS